MLCDAHTSCLVLADCGRLRCVYPWPPRPGKSNGSMEAVLMTLTQALQALCHFTSHFKPEICWGSLCRMAVSSLQSLPSSRHHLLANAPQHGCEELAAKHTTPL